MKIRHEINIINRVVSGVPGVQSDKISVDVSKYSGSITSYFEVIAMKGITPPSRVEFYDSGNNEHGECLLGVFLRRIRSVVSVALTTDEYHINVPYGDETVCAARIIIIQDTGANDLTACESQFEVGDYISDVWSETPTISPLAYPKYWYYDSAKWDGTITAYAEVCWKVIDDMDWVSVHLQVDDGAFANWTTAVTIVNQGGSEDPVLTRSASFSLTSGRNYRIGIETEGDKAGEGITIYNAKIIIQQTTGVTARDNDSSISFYGGDGANNNEAVGQSFTTIGAFDISKIALRMFKTGAPTDNVYIEIAETIDGATIANGTSNNVPCSGFGAVEAWFDFEFSTAPSLSATTVYYFRLLRSGNYDVVNFPKVRMSAGEYSGGVCYEKDIGVWGSNPGYDIGFEVFSTIPITKLEPQMLLVNTGKTGTGLQDYDQLYDADEWSGITKNIYPEHDASQAASNTKLQEDPNETPSDVANSSITGANRQRGGTALSITDDETIDTNIVAV